MWWLTGPLDGDHHKRLEDYSIVVTGLSNTIGHFFDRRMSLAVAGFSPTVTAREIGPDHSTQGGERCVDTGSGLRPPGRDVPQHLALCPSMPRTVAICTR